MIITLDGSLVYDAHVWREIDYFIRLWFVYIYSSCCFSYAERGATYSDLTSNISTMVPLKHSQSYPVTGY